MKLKNNIVPLKGYIKRPVHLNLMYGLGILNEVYGTYGVSDERFEEAGRAENLKNGSFKKKILLEKIVFKEEH